MGTADHTRCDAGPCSTRNIWCDLRRRYSRGIDRSTRAGRYRLRLRSGLLQRRPFDRRRRHCRLVRRECPRRHARGTGSVEQRCAELREHRDCRACRSRTRRGVPLTRARVLLEFSRPFTLVAPALGFASGAATAAGAGPGGPWNAGLLLYPFIGLVMAAVLNAASNALNQIYDLEIDRINKPKRPLPSGRLSLKKAWTFTLVTYVVALVLAWFVEPGARHECFWIVVVA